MSTNMGSEIVARSVDLSRLLEGIDQGAVVLPDFQRDFVWSDGELMVLVATVMVGWPAGSLLLMEGSPPFFNTREFSGVTRKIDQVSLVVLDGQQRLTALYSSFR